MGIDYDGGMIVGASGSDISEPEDYEDGLSEWAEENEMTSMSQHFDADEDDRYYGFEVPDVLVSEMRGKWLENIEQLAVKFEELTGEPALLIGTQNIW